MTGMRKKCEPNCTCLRHTRSRTGQRQEPVRKTRNRRYGIDDIRRGECTAVDEGIKCMRGVRSVKLQLCMMHYARWERHGTTERLPTNGRRPASELTAAHRAKLAARNERRAKAGLETLHEPCMCSHAAMAHKMLTGSGIGGCLKTGCKCEAFSEANPLKHKKNTNKIRELGFQDHLNDEALCIYCSEQVNIGKWYDPLVFRRVRAHLIECHGFRKKSALSSRPDRADTVLLDESSRRIRNVTEDHDSVAGETSEGLSC